MHAQRVNQEDVAEQAGVSSSGMHKWRRGVSSPNLCGLEACLNVRVTLDRRPRKRT